VTTLFDLPFEDPEGPESPAADTPPPRRVFTVSQLTAGIRTVLESSFFEVWVEGEISNCRLWNNGHLYFTLKDEAAQVRGVMFRSALRLLRFKPEDGLHVTVRGRIGVYEPKGEYQIVCEHMEPEGLGALQLAFDQLKKRLQQEGLFDQSRKRPLPLLPRRIAVVTSIDGAALRDILKVLGRRHPNAHIVIAPARVQGEGAAADLERALTAVTRLPGVDVAIIGRGGGSIEDLWAFNDERLARAIAAAPVPIISAVGHEVDFTIADFVADVRAPTPSAAAEVVVAHRDEFCSRIDGLSGRLTHASRIRLERSKGRVHQVVARPGLAGFAARLAMRGRHAAELSHSLRQAGREHLARRNRAHQALRLRLEVHDPGERLARIQARLSAGIASLKAAAVRYHHRCDARLRTAAARLHNLSPLVVLGRGYAVCWSADRTRIVRDAATVQAGDTVRVSLQRGELECDVRSTHGEAEET
jgi:exodeoxyribonuclease VII large subunit